MARLTLEDKRTLVGQALRSVNNPITLECDSSRLGLLLGVKPEQGQYWGQGIALAAKVRAAAERVAQQIEGLDVLSAQRSLLLHVLAGGSISGWAKTRGISREQASRRYFKQVVELVARELFGRR